MYFGERFLLEVVAYTNYIYILPNGTSFENITICMLSPRNIPLKDTENELLLFTR